MLSTEWGIMRMLISEDCILGKKDSIISNIPCERKVYKTEI